MRCLGRLIALLVLLLLVGAGWLYRDDLRRWVDVQLHPGLAALRVGRPSAAALRSATAKLDSLDQTRRDSVRLTASEMASLIARGTAFLPGTAADSLTVELGDRAVRIRTVLDSTEIPAQIREMIPGGPRRFEEIVVRGGLTPVRAGLGELELQHVSIRGVPLPGDLIARFATQASGRGNDGRLDVVLPETVGGFRVRPDGVAVYRQGASK